MYCVYMSADHSTASGTVNTDASLGHIYVIRFSTGACKAGKTIDYPRRLKEHETDARRLRVTVAGQWCSAPHWNYESNERELLALLGKPSAAQEYYHDVDFDHVVTLALSRLNYLKINLGQQPAPTLPATDANSVPTIRAINPDIDIPKDNDRRCHNDIMAILMASGIFGYTLGQMHDEIGYSHPYLRKVLGTLEREGRVGRRMRAVDGENVEQWVCKARSERGHNHIGPITNYYSNSCHGCARDRVEMGMNSDTPDYIVGFVKATREYDKALADGAEDVEYKREELRGWEAEKNRQEEVFTYQPDPSPYGNISWHSLISEKMM
jgi:hypothetical protein